MGNIIPQLSGCTPPLDFVEARVLHRPCCTFPFEEYTDDNCIDYLEYIRACGNPCRFCAENIPLAVQLVKTRYEEDCRRFPDAKWGRSPAWRLATVLSQEWGVQFDCTWKLDLTLSFCEWLEERQYHEQSVDTWSWSIVLGLVNDGLDSSGSSSVVLRELWRERQRTRSLFVRSIELAGCIMLHQYRVPRDVRRIIYRMIGGISKWQWQQWSVRLPALSMLWKGREGARKQARDARFALEVCMRMQYLGNEPTASGFSLYDDIMEIMEENTQLYSRSAWLHWVTGTLQSQGRK